MKRKYVILVLIGLMVLLMPSIVSAEDGWQKEGDYLYFYKNDENLTGTQTIDGKIYTFSESGYLKGNNKVQEVGGSYYYLDSDNSIQYGWQTISEEKYYFNPDNGKALKGEMFYQTHLIGDKYYLFNDNGVLVVNDWWSYWDYVGPFYHSDENGCVLEGYRKIGDELKELCKDYTPIVTDGFDDTPRPLIYSSISDRIDKLYHEHEAIHMKTFLSIKQEIKESIQYGGSEDAKSEERV